jgi:putative membrane protein
MLKFAAKAVFHVLSNAVALLVAAYFVAGFVMDGSVTAILITAAILTAINTFVKPILKLFLGPLILLTFGLFSIVINGIALFILDIFSDPLTIQGYIPLLYGTLIVTVVNMVLALAGKWIYKE